MIGLRISSVWKFPAVDIWCVPGWYEPTLTLCSSISYRSSRYASKMILEVWECWRSVSACDKGEFPHTCTMQCMFPCICLYHNHQREEMKLHRWSTERKPYDVWGTSALVRSGAEPQEKSTVFQCILLYFSVLLVSNAYGFRVCGYKILRQEFTHSARFRCDIFIVQTVVLSCFINLLLINQVAFQATVT